MQITVSDQRRKPDPTFSYLSVGKDGFCLLFHAMKPWWSFKNTRLNLINPIQYRLMAEVILSSPSFLSACYNLCFVLFENDYLILSWKSVRGEHLRNLSWRKEVECIPSAHNMFDKTANSIGATICRGSSPRRRRRRMKNIKYYCCRKQFWWRCWQKPCRSSSTSTNNLLIYSFDDQVILILHSCCSPAFMQIVIK